MLTQKGMSLIECTLCLALVGLTTTTLLPALVDLSTRTQAQSTTNLLLARLQQARTASIINKRVVTVCAGLERCSGSTSWQGHLLMFEDRNSNGQRDNNEKILLQEALPDKHTWRWSSFRRKPFLQYQPDGTTRALNGTFTLCQSGTATFQVIVSLEGRSRSQVAPSNYPNCI